MLHQRTITHLIIASFAVCAAAMSIGCSRAPTPQAHNASETEAASQDVPPSLARIFRPVARPETVPPLSDVRTAAKPGDRVVVEAAVIGTARPFVERRAVFVVGDPERIETCDKHEGDTCPTPWDACCEDSRTIRENTATIQIVDDRGAVLAIGLRGINGLREMSRVRVEGEVAPTSDTQALVINAIAIEIL